MNTATIKTPYGEDATDITPKTSVNVGAAEVGIITTEYGDASFHKTELALADFVVGSATGAAALCFGEKLYTLPAGIQNIKSVYMSLALTGTTTIVGDTPEVGIGSVLGAGVHATIGAAGATMEDYWEGVTSGVIDGTNAVTDIKVATAGAQTGIALNAVGDSKALYLNVADTWAGAGDVIATGTITIEWEMIN